MKREDRKLYLLAALKWGELAQLDVAIEECAELMVKMSHVKRGRAHIMQIAEEVADVEIMMEQLRVMVGPNKVQQFRATKLARLAKRVGKNQVGL